MPLVSNTRWLALCVLIFAVFQAASAYEPTYTMPWWAAMYPPEQTQALVEDLAKLTAPGTNGTLEKLMPVTSLPAGAEAVLMPYQGAGMGAIMLETGATVTARRATQGKLAAAVAQAKANAAAKRAKNTPTATTTTTAPAAIVTPNAALPPIPAVLTAAVHASTAAMAAATGARTSTDGSFYPAGASGSTQADTALMGRVAEKWALSQRALKAAEQTAKDAAAVLPSHANDI